MLFRRLFLFSVVTSDTSSTCLRPSPPPHSSYQKYSKMAGNIDRVRLQWFVGNQGVFVQSLNTDPVEKFDVISGVVQPFDYLVLNATGASFDCTFERL